MYRCISDIFGYCFAKPNSELREIEVTHLDYRGKPFTQKTPVEVCLNNPRNCSFYQTHSQRLAKIGIAPGSVEPSQVT